MDLRLGTLMVERTWAVTKKTECEIDTAEMLNVEKGSVTE